MHVSLKGKRRIKSTHFLLGTTRQSHPLLILMKLLKHHFKTIFTSSNPTKLAIDECLVNIKILVSEEMNLELTKSYSLDEIQVPLNPMGPLKFLGLDGFMLISSKPIGTSLILKLAN